MTSLRIRFAIGFFILFTIFLTTALAIIYISYADFRQDEFYSRLKDRALTTFKFLVEVDQIDNDLLALIDKNTLNSLYDERVIIFKDRDLIYQSPNDHKIIFDDEMFQKAMREKVYYTSHDEYEVVAINIDQNNSSYTVFASAYDRFGLRKMNYLKGLMLIVYFSGLVLAVGATYFFVKYVIRPLDMLNNNVERINSENLHIRLPEGGQGKEVDRMARNFNQMLKRLQESFQFQKDFVHYASHELRTPLTAMVGVTENALSKTMTADESRDLLAQIYRQQQELTSITNSLLLLSGMENRIQEYPQLRLDEIVFRAVEIARNMYPSTDIRVNLEGDISNEDLLMVCGNEPLLLMAFNNLLKNAIQYSKFREVTVTIRLNLHEKEVEFINTGDVIPEEEYTMLFTPFFRGSNATNTNGHGLGLSLVKQIAKLNNAMIRYYRRENLNIFVFSFQRKVHQSVPVA